VDYNPKTICVVMTGKPSKINAFIEILRPLGIVELCRTGVVAIERNKAIYNV
ncbi:MAG: acetolactate synthase small subunit, partial [Elusimicrobia bacterium]|nr:acetolactate synthase small subunit [Elusimicrobiota bacterium]